MLKFFLTYLFIGGLIVTLAAASEGDDDTQDDQSSSNNDTSGAESLIYRIINWFLSLFGGDGDKPPGGQI